jgi:lipopolysaccharide/colanic/teichoic acid biosynthesis glycosyltransferase
MDGYTGFNKKRVETIFEKSYYKKTYDLYDLVNFYPIENIFLRNQWLLYFVSFLILTIIFMLILTIVIAAITLVERKTLALVQRRVGPNQTAFRGRFQFIADALKLLNKSIFIIRDTKRTLFIV